MKFCESRLRKLITISTDSWTSKKSPNLIAYADFTTPNKSISKVEKNLEQIWKNEKNTLGKSFTSVSI
jgi:hypothetical protein